MMKNETESDRKRGSVRGRVGRNRESESEELVNLVATKLVRPDMVAPDCATRGHGGADFFLIESVIKVSK